MDLKKHNNIMKKEEKAHIKAHTRIAKNYIFLLYGCAVLYVLSLFFFISIIQILHIAAPLLVIQLWCPSFLCGPLFYHQHLVTPYSFYTKSVLSENQILLPDPTYHLTFTSLSYIKLCFLVLHPVII